MNTLKMLALSTALAGTVATASAQMKHEMHEGAMSEEHMGSMMEMMQPAENDAESTKAFKQADMDMMQGMAVPYTGDPDVDFRQKMIPHHQGAIDMAKVALKYAKDPETKAMAEAIIDAQEKEIAEMKAWLAKKGQ